ncbi:non-ribosomal peptide synthetase [Streptomyces sp. NBC_01465]|uniref:non-ribosomal peptide synthetase n=1 Tax=Streptomyces sp. NBC_01465 TaxID=2903878 RepID=UPI002E31907E|nr:non-ribosomal peptide synthetase [Streptomyces sp. NBC_01465]
MRTISHAPAQTVDTLLRETWSAAGDRIAVESEDVTLSYAELLDAVDRFAAALTRNGVRREQRVAILLDRSADLVVAQLAVVFAGGTQLAIDPDDPDERVLFMVEDSRPAVVITSGAHRSRIGDPPCPVLLIEELDTSEPAPAGPLPGRNTADTTAYAIYTSGSTGRPKASLVPHRALVSRLRWLQRTYGLTPSDRVLYKTACGFDVSVAELYWPLSAGAQLVVAAPGGQRDPDYLADAVLHRGITTLHFVPSLLDLFLNCRPPHEQYPGLRLLLAGGEALSPDLVRRFHARTPAALHNMYGPSECAVYTTSWECPRDPAPDLVLIGSAVDDTELLVLDGMGREVPPGETGELYIGGAGLARAYLNRPALTAERFVPHPQKGNGHRLYRSGDLVREHHDGGMEFMGRSDTQVKVRGNRVEPDEVRNALLQLPGVAQAAVIAVTEGERTELAGFFVPADDVRPAVDALRAALRKILPGYMVPATLTSLDVLPLTSNGKLDRAALAQLTRDLIAAAACLPDAPETVGDPPQGQWEEAIAEVWQEVLAAPPLGREDDFFDVGGDSLTAVTASQRLGHRLGHRIPLEMIYEESTVRYYAEDLAALLAGEAVADGRAG